MNEKLKGLIKDAQSKFGSESVMMLSDMPVRPPISSGSIALDFAVGLGGLPPDRVIEISGRESTGKTTLAILAMSSFLDAQPGRAALILDTEAKLTSSWVESLVGAQRMQRVLLARPSHAEQATDIYTDLVGTGDVCFVLYDSIGGAPSMSTTGKSAEVGEIGGNAKAISRFARLASTYSAKAPCLTVGINQVRDELNARHPGQLGTPGGHAWKHACVLRIQLRRGDQRVFEKVDGEPLQVGGNVVAKCIKNQLAPPGRTAMWWFYNVPTDKYGFGIDTAEEVIRLATVAEVVERKGGWYYHDLLPGGKVQGMERLMEVLRGDDCARSAIVAATMDSLGRRHELIGRVAPMSDEPEGDLVEGDLVRAAISSEEGHG